MVKSKQPIIFQDRSEAGKILAERLFLFKKDKPIVLVLPRGGVPVGFEVAKEFKTKLDLLIVRKIGSPDNPEFGIGAICEGELCIWTKKRFHAQISRGICFRS